MTYRPFIIDTSDKRCEYLFDSFTSQGFVALKRQDCISPQVGILIMPPAKTIDTNDVTCLETGSAVFGGKASMDGKKWMSQMGITYFNIMQDERFTVKNTIPTALGCIQVVMESRDECINELKTLVIGYGRVAKTLCKYLLALDTKTYVYTVDPAEKALCEVLTSGASESLDNICDYELIINTVPAKLITSKVADKISKSAFVCDLASGDFVDIKYLISSGVDAMKAPSLPAKVAPKSAALYMEECIIDTLNRNTNLRSLFLIQ